MPEACSRIDGVASIPCLPAPRYTPMTLGTARQAGLPQMADGHCLCGAVHYRVEGAFGEVRYCHCTRCRRGNGTAFSANAKVPRSAWTASDPQSVIREYEQKPGIFRAFCSRCGSPIYARLESDPNHVRVRLGGFEGPLDVNVTAHVWISCKAPWYAMEVELPCFAEGFDGPR
jgi:hypothetical protein